MHDVLFYSRCELFDQNLKSALEVAEKAGTFGTGSWADTPPRQWRSLVYVQQPTVYSMECGLISMEPKVVDKAELC